MITAKVEDALDQFMRDRSGGCRGFVSTEFQFHIVCSIRLTLSLYIQRQSALWTFPSLLLDIRRCSNICIVHVLVR